MCLSWSTPYVLVPQNIGAVKGIEYVGVANSIPADPACTGTMLGAAAMLTAGADRAGCAAAAAPDDPAGGNATEATGARPSCVAAATRAAAAFPLHQRSCQRGVRIPAPHSAVSSLIVVILLCNERDPHENDDQRQLRVAI